MNGGRSRAVALFAAAGLFSACSASTAPLPGPSVASGASKRTGASSAISPSSAAPTGTTTPSSGPRSTTPTVVSDLAVRFPKTQRGAEDFVRFVMAQVSKAYATGDPSLVRPLVDVTRCPDCGRWISITTDMGQKDERFVGIFVELQSVRAVTLKDDACGVITQVLVPAGKTVDSTGRTVEPRQAAGPFRTDFFLQFRDHWVVTNTEIVR